MFYKIITHNSKQVIFLSLFLIGLLLVYFGYESFNWQWNLLESWADYFWKTVDPIAGIGTAVLTIIILYNQGKERYLKALEKRLSIDYKFNDDVILKVEEAYLAGESDIRQWAQQLGRQLCANKKYLSFDMVLQTTDEGKIIYKANKKDILHYKVEIYLDKDPREGLQLETEEERESRLEKSHSNIVKDKDSICNYKKPSEDNYLLKKEIYENSRITRKKNDVWIWERLE